jgi:hypothetical protein
VVDITTLDTTSQRFTFRLDTIGVGSSSILRDIVIVSDTLIYAVGEVFLNDPAGGIDPDPYGLVRGDGLRWNIERLTTSFPSGYQVNLTPSGILFFSPNDIWLADGGVHHFNGQAITQSYWFNAYQGNSNVIWDSVQAATKIFGTSSSNLYAVGTAGAVAHFDGSSWRNVVTDTRLPIQDIWGAFDPITGEERIICIASDKYTTPQKRVFKIVGETAVAVSDSGLPWSLSGTWSDGHDYNFIVGDGMYFNDVIDVDGSWRSFHQGLTTFYTNSIRGKSMNDIAVAGAYGVLLHYNGSSWKNYQNQTNLTFGSYYGVDVNGRLMVAVGQLSDRAVVAIGNR